jgi:hypothetical protein
MKHTRPVMLVAIIALAALILPACAVSGHHAVIQREIDFATAMQQKDIAALEDIMAPDFRLTLEKIPPFALTIDEGNPSPGLPGWRWRGNLEQMSFGRIEMARVDSVRISDDLVAVNMVMTLDKWVAEDPRGARTLSGSYELTDTWLNRDGTWRIIGRYSRPRPDMQRPSPDFVMEHDATEE